MDLPTCHPYKKYEQKRKQHNEQADCCVCSISHACGVSYEEAHAACKKAGRKHRQGMYDDQIIKAVRILGFKLTKVKCKSKTFRTLYKNIRSNLPFLVFFNGHLSSIVNMQTWDDYMKNKCVRIQCVYLVEKLGNSPTFSQSAK